MLVGLLAAAHSSPAGASCAGPTLDPIDPVVPGGALTITGRTFGTNCYDTGPPPDGEGALGVPVRGIVLVVEQGGNEVVVARGSADADYGFTVDATAPPSLAPGSARVLARWTMRGGGRVEQALDVRAGEPASESEGTTRVVSFGPDRAVVPADAAASDDDAPTDGLPTPVIGGLFLVVVVGVVVTTVVLPRRRARRTAGAPER